MALSTSIHGDKPKMPTNFYLSTPLYLATTIISLAVLLLLIFSGDGYEDSREHDDLLLIPTLIPFFSLMTGPIRCTFWVLAFCVQVKWLHPRETSQGQIRLGENEEDERRNGRRYEWVGKVLLSWNACMAAALTASLGVLIWRLVENARGRVLAVQAGYAAAFLGVAM